MSAANIVDASAVALPIRYTAGERLGHGASGETFAVVDTTDGAACVAKVFAAGAAARGAAVNELSGLQALAHPSVVRVRDIGRLEVGRLFLVTERLSGASVASIASCVDEADRRAALQRAASSDRLAMLATDAPARRSVTRNSRPSSRRPMSRTRTTLGLSLIHI